MCGICGVVTAGPPPDLSVVRSMIGRLTHRGPDGCGYFRDRHAALGHTRLSIIDGAGGAQPLTNEDGRIWLTFNGEIFNYVELREQLRDRGHRFRTASDTEVIVHAWEEWGEDCFSRFNGQWALALWDRLERRLVLSRDRLGVRPLYYTFDNGRLIFASEVKAIFADPSVRASLRSDRPGRDPHVLVHGRPADRVCRDRAARAWLRRDVRQCRLPQGALLDADVPATGPGAASRLDSQRRGAARQAHRSHPPALPSQ